MADAPEPQQDVLPVETEHDRVKGWRLFELLRAGYPVTDAEALADRFDIDLHVAVELVKHGCPADTAARILL